MFNDYKDICRIFVTIITNNTPPIHKDSTLHTCIYIKDINDLSLSLNVVGKVISSKYT